MSIFDVFNRKDTERGTSGKPKQGAARGKNADDRKLVHKPTGMPANAKSADKKDAAAVVAAETTMPTVHMHTIIRPVVTEKATRLMEKNTYTFIVHTDASKHRVAQAVTDLYKVKVAQVRISAQPGKKRQRKGHVHYTSDLKKALVTLRAGEKIDFTPAS